MLHASEGMLHAYLDGALDEVAAGEAQSIREHIAGCGTCAVRLEEVKAVRDRASAILGAAVPQVELLPLEELRARAEATVPPSATRPRRRLNRMGWAASIMLALGAGWMLRGDAVSPIGAVDPIESNGQPVLPAAPVQAMGDVVVERGDEDARLLGETVAEMSVDVVAQAPPVGGRDDIVGFAAKTERAIITTASAGGAAAGAAHRETATDVTPRPSLRQMDAAVSPLSLAARFDTAARMQAEERAADARVRTRDVAAELVMLDPPLRDSVRLEEDRGVMPADEEERGPPPIVTSALDVAALTQVDFDAEDRKTKDDEELSQIVPGLDLIVTEYVDEVPGLIRVQQSLGGGETLEILHVPAGVDPETLPPFEGDGKTGVIAPRNGGHVILRAPRSVDELKILLDRLNGIS